MQLLSELAEQRLASFRHHCLSTGDEGARAWWFTDGPSTPAVLGHQTFGTAHSSLRIHLLDPYHGRAPTLINLTTLRDGPNVQISLVPFVIFDSNVISYVNAYLNGREEHIERRGVTEEFLRFVFERGLDPSPVFYFMESLARADSSRWRERAAGFAGTLFDVQTLDRELFLNEGRLASSLSARRQQMGFQKTSDSTELMEKYLDSLSPDTVLAEVEKIDLTYAALMKATLLRVDSGTSLPDRFVELGDFMATRLGAVLGLEGFAGVLHWVAPERFARLLTPLQTGARADRLFSKLRSTAWDIYLGRLPEQFGRFIPNSDPGEAEAVCNLYYVATGEDSLADLLRHRSIELLIQHSNCLESSVLVGHRPGILADLLDAPEMEELSARSAEWERNIMKSAHLRTPIGGADLEKVIVELQAAITAICEDAL